MNPALIDARALRRVALFLGFAFVCLAGKSITAERLAFTQEKILYSFMGGGDGTFPEGNVVADPSGALYSTTQYGGSGCKSGCGTAFKLTPSGSGYVKRIIYEFHGNAEGGYPEAGFIMDGSGALYGTLISGGLSACKMGCGTVFKLTPNGSAYRLHVLYAFRGGADGNAPWAGLAMDQDGALYGTTVNGGGAKKKACRLQKGLLGCGIVFKLTPAKSGYTERVLYAFKGTDDGALPYGALAIDKAGALYGTTSAGGSPTCSCGTVFKLTPSRSQYIEQTLHRFNGGDDGAAPYAGVIVDSHGMLYGTTQYGGGTVCGVPTGCGTVFELVPMGSRYRESVLYAFRGGRNDGAYPDGSPAMDAKGALYGTTQSGGTGMNCRTGGCGTVYRLARSHSSFRETVVHSFEGGTDGSFPQSSVLIGADGSLYGTAASGGAEQSGIVFQLVRRR